MGPRGMRIRRGKVSTIKSSYIISLNIIRVIQSRRLRKAGDIVRMDEGRSAFKILIGNPLGNIPLGRPRHRWEDNIRMDLKQMAVNTRKWVDLAKNRDYWRTLVNAALNLQIP